jgi:hypothetical protein
MRPIREGGRSSTASHRASQHISLTRGVNTFLLQGSQHISLTRGVNTYFLRGSQHISLTRGVNTYLLRGSQHISLTRGVNTYFLRGSQHISLTRGVNTFLLRGSQHISLARKVNTFLLRGESTSLNERSQHPCTRGVNILVLEESLNKFMYGGCQSILKRVSHRTACGVQCNLIQGSLQHSLM